MYILFFYLKEEESNTWFNALNFLIYMIMVNIYIFLKKL